MHKGVSYEFQTKTEVRVFRMELTCPECRAGKMESTGEYLAVNPPIYIHYCTNCKAEGRSRTRHPYITYEPLKEI